jgi:hypothetical protein
VTPTAAGAEVHEELADPARERNAGAGRTGTETALRDLVLSDLHAREMLSICFAASHGR